jgi:hypothetical protein
MKQTITTKEAIEKVYKRFGFYITAETFRKWCVKYNKEFGFARKIGGRWWIDALKFNKFLNHRKSKDTYNKE